MTLAPFANTGVTPASSRSNHMVTSVLRIAVSGLNAAQAGLATTGHNIANVNTPGYSRQETIQATNPGQFTGSGYFGRGVNVETIVRRYDSLLTAQVRQATAAQSHFDTQSAQASNIDNLLGDQTVGLTPALADFFAGINAVAIIVLIMFYQPPPGSEE